MGAQVALVEQDEKFFVVGSGVGIVKHKRFKISFTRKPISRSITKQLMEIVEISVAYLIADFDGSSRMTCFSEQRAKSVLEEFIVDGAITNR